MTISSVALGSGPLWLPGAFPTARAHLASVASDGPVGILPPHAAAPPQLRRGSLHGHNAAAFSADLPPGGALRRARSHAFTARSHGFLGKVQDATTSSASSFKAGDAEEVEEEASEAESVASMSEADLRRVLEKANEAAEDALAAAQVAVWTEAVAAVGTIAGILTTWIGWKMDESQLPPELQLPEDSGGGLPAELKRPPPGTAISSLVTAPQTSSSGVQQRPVGVSASPPLSSAGRPAATSAGAAGGYAASRGNTEASAAAPTKAAAAAPAKASTPAPPATSGATVSPATSGATVSPATSGTAAAKPAGPPPAQRGSMPPAPPGSAPIVPPAGARPLAEDRPRAGDQGDTENPFNYLRQFFFLFMACPAIAEWYWYVHSEKGRIGHDTWLTFMTVLVELMMAVKYSMSFNTFRSYAPSWDIAIPWIISASLFSLSFFGTCHHYYVLRKDRTSKPAWLLVVKLLAVVPLFALTRLWAF